MKGLGPFSFDVLTHPWALIGIVGVVVLLAAEWFTRSPGAMNISTGETLARFATMWRVRFGVSSKGS